LESIKRYYRIDRREINFIKCILEAYDGIAMLTTVDPEAGIVLLHISSGCENDVDMIFQDLKKDIMIEHISERPMGSNITGQNPL